MINVENLSQFCSITMKTSQRSNNNKMQKREISFFLIWIFMILRNFPNLEIQSIPSITFIDGHCQIFIHNNWKFKNIFFAFLFTSHTQPQLDRLLNVVALQATTKQWKRGKNWTTWRVEKSNKFSVVPSSSVSRS
jgi:hypothetical protein